jgi:chromate transporter
MTMRPAREVRPWAIAIVLLKVGMLAFGGPAAHVALMRRELVERRGWIDEQSFFRMYAACNLVPGPSSTELAIFLGYRLAGWSGLLLSGVLFIAPAMLLMLGFGWLYLHFGTSTLLQAALHGVRPVVVGIVAWAVLDLGRRLLRGVPLSVLAAATCALSLLGANPILLLLGSGAVWLALALGWGRLRQLRDAAGVVLPLVSWTWDQVASSPKLLTIFLTFLKLGAVAYGSGYVLFALLHAEFVQGLHWLSQQQLVDAVAIGQVTPGPVFTTATFLGYLFGGISGGLLATLGMFLPSFALVPLLDRIDRLVQTQQRVRTLLDGVNVAALGLIGAVGLQLGAASVHDALTLLMAAVTFGVLLRFPLAAPALVAAGVLLGVGLARA